MSSPPDPLHIDRKTKSTKTQRGIVFYPADIELMNWGVKYLGCSQSEFVRSAVRAFATNLQQIQKG